MVVMAKSRLVNGNQDSLAVHCVKLKQSNRLRTIPILRRLYKRAITPFGSLPIVLT